MEGLFPEPDYIQKEEINIEWYALIITLSLNNSAGVENQMLYQLKGLQRVSLGNFHHHCMRLIHCISGMDFNIPFSSHSLHGLYNFKLGVDPFDSFTLGKTVMQLDEVLLFYS